MNSNTGNNRYYSFNRGFTHFLVFTAESYVCACELMRSLGCMRARARARARERVATPRPSPSDTLRADSVDSGFNTNQLNFMKADLAAVDRSVTPWVVALVHKDYSMQPNAYKDFSPVLESMGVDVLFCGCVRAPSRAARLEHPRRALRSRRMPTLPLFALPPSPLVSTLNPPLLSHVHYYNRFRPYDAVTGAIDKASISADGSTYSNPKYMTTIVSGGAGNREDESHYVKADPSYTGVENYGASRRRAAAAGATVCRRSRAAPLPPALQSPARQSPRCRLGHLAGAECDACDVELAHVGRQRGPRRLDRFPHHRADGPRPLSDDDDPAGSSFAHTGGPRARALPLNSVGRAGLIVGTAPRQQRQR